MNDIPLPTGRPRLTPDEVARREAKKLNNERQCAKQFGLTLEEYRQRKEERAAIREAKKQQRLTLERSNPAALREELEQQLATVPDWWRTMAIKRFTRPNL